MAKHYIHGDDTNKFSKSGTTITVKNGNVEKALRRFKKMVTEEGIIHEYRDRKSYVGKSEQVRKDMAAGTKRWKKKLEKSE